MNWLVRIELAVIRLYRAVHDGRPSPCRFVPSCSAYAMDALDLHGFWRGNRLLSIRLLRCRPWGGWGADPVPLPSSAGSSRRAHCS